MESESEKAQLDRMVAEIEKLFEYAGKKGLQLDETSVQIFGIMKALRKAAETNTQKDQEIAVLNTKLDQLIDASSNLRAATKECSQALQEERERSAQKDVAIAALEAAAVQFSSSVPSSKKQIEQAIGTDRPQSKRERNNLLKIIRALCSMQSLDLKQPYKVAGNIATKLESLGDKLDPETIAAKLKDAEKS